MSSPKNAARYIQRREAFNRMAELCLWIALAALVLVRPLFYLQASDMPVGALFEFWHFEIWAGSIVLFFPVVFRLIFGALPLDSIRRKRAQRQLRFKDFQTPSELSVENQTEEVLVLSDSLSAEEIASSPATRLFAYYAASSRRLSQSIYSRAGVYLLVGVFVAFSGLVFFYSQTAQLLNLSDNGITMFVSLVPKFGILFFIEIVAFFFLRQYRAAMDEFRYYEAIKRNREETLALIRIAADSGKPFDPIDLVKSDSFFSKAGVLAKEQSTEIIESRKLEKNELDLLEKVIDLVSRSKK